MQQIPRGSVLQCKQGTCTALEKAPLNGAATQKQPQRQFGNKAAWVILRNKIQTVRGSEWDTLSVSCLLGDLCAKTVPLDKGCEKHLGGVCSGEEGAEAPQLQREVRSWLWVTSLSCRCPACH